MLQKRTNQQGLKIFFSPEEKDAPAEIKLAGITFPKGNYSATINNLDHAIECYQFEYVTEGKGYIEINNSVAEVTAGDFFLIRRNVPRKLYSDKKTPMGKIFVTVKGYLIDTMVKSYGFDADLNIVKADVGTYFNTIIDKINKSKLQTAKLRNDIVCELLKILQDSYLCHFGHKLQGSDQIAYEIAQYIAKNLHKKISLRELCDHFFLGETQLIKVFKRKYDDTPMNYIQNMRISKAMYFIRNTDNSIAEIAERLGFSDPGYFSKVFKKYYGISPLACRKNPLKAARLVLTDPAKY